MPAEDFEGLWTVDQAQSDSIEPMLKGMGVGWRIRKIVTILKVVQKIEVKGKELLVSNISKHGQDTTTHVMNVGERVIKTNRGDEVIDNCTYQENREFPLEIVAILPSNKGSTVDKRKVLEGKEKFVQELIYKYPEGVNKPDIIMKRVFIRLPDSTDTSQSVESPVVEDKEQSGLRHRRSSASPQEPARPPTQHHQVPQEVHSHVTTLTASSKAVDLGVEEGNSPDLWILATFAMVAFTLLFAAVKNGLLSFKTATPVLVMFSTVYVVCRSLARTNKGVQLALNPHVRWVGVALAMLVCTVAFFGSQAIATDKKQMSESFRVLVFGSATAWLIFARVSAGPLLEAVEENARLSLLGAFLVASGASIYHFGWTHLYSGVCLFLAGFVWFAMFYESSIGYTRFDLHKKSKPSKEKRVVDREGNTLSVAVVGFRVVDDLYAQYKLRVKHEGKTWFLWRRFSQFDSLRHELRRVFGHGVLPPLPSKTWFSSLDEDFLQERTLELDEFIQKLFDPATLRNQVFKIAEAKKFLGIGQGRSKKSGAVSAVQMGDSRKPSLKATPAETAQFVQILKKAQATFDQALAVGEGDGWKFLKNHQGVQCYLKTEGDLTYTKGVGVINFPPLVVAAFMADLSKRSTYDDLFKRDTVLREVKIADVAEGLGNMPVDVCDVKHVEFKSPFPMAISARDCVLVSCRMIHPDGTCKVILASPPDSYKPPTSKYTRATVMAAGILLAPNPAKPGTTIMSSVQMMDPNGSIPGYIVKAVAPDRCAMSVKVEAAMKKLATLPDPLPIPSVHLKEQ